MPTCPATRVSKGEWAAGGGWEIFNIFLVLDFIMHSLTLCPQKLLFGFIHECKEVLEKPVMLFEPLPSLRFRGLYGI